jgi:hypothetical protein
LEVDVENRAAALTSGYPAPNRGRLTRKDDEMRFMLLQNYGEVGSGCPPMNEWSPADIKAHIDFQNALNQELTARGELVDAQGLAGPDQAKFVVSDGASAPVITDGPFPESKELLAGYRMVDVDTLERALEIAAQTSAARGPDGVPVQQAIEVRQVLSAPDPEV